MMASDEQNNGNGIYRGMPWQIRALAIIGGPLAFAFILLYINNGIMAETKKAADAAMIEARGTLTAIREHQDSTVHMIQLLERICRRVSRTDFEKDNC